VEGLRSNLRLENTRVSSGELQRVNKVSHRYAERVEKLHDKELNDLYTSPNIVRVTKSIRMRWAGHVARMGERKANTEFCWGNLRRRDNLGDPGIDGRIILRWMFRMWDVGVRTGSSWLIIGTDGGQL